MLRFSKLLIVLSLSIVLFFSTTVSHFSTNISIQNIIIEDTSEVNQILEGESKLIIDKIQNNNHLSIDLLQNDSKIVVEDVLNETLLEMNVLPRDFVLDSSNNFYIIGDIDNYDPSFANNSFGAGGMNDTIIMKFDSNLDLLWNTIIGGTDNDVAYQFTLDEDFGITFWGISESLFFPTHRATRTQFNSTSSQDNFIGILSIDGSELIYSSYFANDGSKDTIYRAKTVESGSFDNRCLAIAGQTSDKSFPLVNANDSTLELGEERNDGFLILYAVNDAWISDGASIPSIHFSTYIGGSLPDVIRDFDVIESTFDYEIYLVGKTESSDLPIVNPTHDELNGSADILIAKFLSNGKPEYISYFGASGLDGGSLIKIDINQKSQIILGGTKSTDFETTIGAYDRIGDQNPSSTDSFILKLGLDGKRVINSTYFGGSSHEYGYFPNIERLTQDSTGNIILSIPTVSTDFPVVRGSTFPSSTVLAKFTPDLSSLIYSSYISLTSADAVYATSIRLDSNDIPYFLYESYIISGYDYELATSLHRIIDDIVLPDISLESVSNGSLITSNTVDFTVSDNYGLSQIEYYWNNNPSIEINISGLSHEFGCIRPQSTGNHTLSLYVADIAGNVKLTKFNFQIDLEKPTISLQSHLNGSYIRSQDKITLEINDNQGIDVANYHWDDNNEISITGSLEISPPDTEGPHDLYIYAKDNSGNELSKKFVFNVDNTGPTVTVNGINNGDKITESILVNVTAHDPIGVNRIEFYLDNELQLNDTSIPYDYIIDLVDLEFGLHSLLIEGYDNINNVNSTTINFEYDEDLISRIGTEVILGVAAGLGTALVTTIGFLYRRSRKRKKLKAETGL